MLVDIDTTEDEAGFVEPLLLFTGKMLDILLLDPIEIAVVEDFGVKVLRNDEELDFVEVASVEEIREEDVVLKFELEVLVLWVVEELEDSSLMLDEVL